MSENFPKNWLLKRIEILNSNVGMCSLMLNPNTSCDILNEGFGSSHHENALDTTYNFYKL